MIKAAIVGGSGYTGGELARLLCRHPRISLEAMTSRQNAGTKVSQVMGYLEGFVDLRFQEKLGEDERYDLVFVAAPHGASMEVVPQILSRGMRVIDLSGDYRLSDMETYRRWYGLEHKDPANFGKAVYGISELFREGIAQARLLANPGCYPTCSTLGLAPLFAKGLVQPHVVVDAKSGTSGAGQQPTAMTHHPHCASQVIPYKVGAHRHAPEIKMALEKVSGEGVDVVFTPHLMPIVRGMLCTCYARLKGPMGLEELHGAYKDFYQGRRFVRVVKGVPSISSVAGSNLCEIGLALAGEDTVVAMSAIDNLVKGGSGQAVQNANIMCGLDEAAGLDFPGLGV
ncbi:MAG: N-acetyl-gamma-glutamyl-phosphate reductase [Methanomassiliicoccales archaeon]|jgi:N-acetyl-gamma-glutamyl-phosphate reductase|nr:N-acetyl-gamma-glutamyl-phosphate reductase [Methanomassiliicoccales archaeon]